MVLRANRERSDAVLKTGCQGKPLDDLALSAGRLDEVDLRMWEGRCEDEAREAGAGAQVHDSLCGAELIHLEAGKAVCDVQIEGLRGFADSRGRIGLRGQGVYQGYDRSLGRGGIRDVEASDCGSHGFT
jgi:hypothetical protein